MIRRKPQHPLWFELNREKSFDPAFLFGKGWQVLEEDERALGLSRIDLAQIVFRPTCSRRRNITESARNFRIVKSENNIPLDAAVFLGIINKEINIPRIWKSGMKSKNIVILFPGTTIIDSKNYRHLLYIEVGSRGGIKWGYKQAKFGKDPNYVFATLPLQK